MMAMSEDRRLAQAMRRTRKRLGESQHDFAERIGINQATISRWEERGPRTVAGRLALRQILGDIDRVLPAVAR